MTSSQNSSVENEHERLIKEIIKSRFGETFDKNQKYLIVIQGATSSGKSTVAKQLNNILVENGVNTKLVGLDSYYLSPDNPLEEDDNYDFDNPASLDWSSIIELLDALQRDDEKLPVYFRRTNRSESNKKEYAPNTFPSVVIVEGIYAFNVINQYKFNLSELDPSDSDKPISKEFVPSDYNLGGFKVIKIFLPLCKNKLWEIRRSRDMKLKKPFESVIKRFEAMIWPDTLRWVYSTLENNDIQVTHGNFNEKNMNLLIKNLVLFFSKNVVDFKKQLEDDMSDEFKVKCSGECNFLRNSNLILKDFE
ncbi:Uridine kinase [Nosema granulosis]|uniref:Uridine kinase n=1 Tax=Nosema granulosis TaxID=83296 RepID=A0A9P6H044_9MICR|nr:Uridine kinase [Nosema granulosis]